MPAPKRPFTAGRPTGGGPPRGGGTGRRSATAPVVAQTKRPEPPPDTSKEECIKIEGLIVEALPNAMFRVEIQVGDQKKVILAYVSGKMRQHFLRVLPGDRVQIELTPYDLERGRITYRWK